MFLNSPPVRDSVCGLITGMLLLLAPFASLLPAQDKKLLTIRAAGGEITIDGVVGREEWRGALEIPIPFETYPGENLPAQVQTRCFISYDENNLYAAFIAADPDPAAIRAYITNRDAIGSHDFVGIIIDTFNDESRAYIFFVNPLGIQYDATRDDLGNGEDSSWDAIWSSAGRITAEGYEVEFAIPFSQIRFPDGGGPLTWGFNGTRMYPRDLRRENSSQKVDRNINGWVRQFSKIQGFEGIKPGHQLQLTPTLIGLRSDERADFPTGEFVERDSMAELGLTAAWGVTPNMTFNIALNPDFSQVEADVAQLDVNTQFALFYDETRPFFLESADLFSSIGAEAIYTRIIADPDYGLKLTGKEGRHSVGVIYARDSTTNILIPGSQGSDSTFLDRESDVTMLRYRLDLPGNSNVGLTVTDREAGDYSNLVAGFDGTWRITNTDRVRFQALGSRTTYPDALADAYGQERGEFDGGLYYLNYTHDERNWGWYFQHSEADEGFRGDAGFVPEVGNRYNSAGLSYTFWRGNDSAFSYLYFGGGGERSEDRVGNRLLDFLNVSAEIGLPYQTFINGTLNVGTRHYLGRDFDQVNGRIGLNSRPSGAVTINFTALLGDLVDFENAQDGGRIRLTPNITWRPTRNWELGVRHEFERFTVDGGRLFLANLSQIRVVYNVNPRLFIRLIAQYTDIQRDVDLYRHTVEAETRRLFNQILLSYKLNPQTVFYLGYSDNSLGGETLSLTRADRTFFAKLGYAWIM